LKPNVLQAGAKYKFAVSVVDSADNKKGKAEVVANVASPPVGGSLAVTPLQGTEFNTQFTLPTSGWDSARLYQFGFHTKWS